MLKSIRIAGYRSIRDETVDFGRLAVMCGPNNAGKSNLLRAVGLLFGPKWPPNALTDDDRNRDSGGAPIEIDARFDPPLSKDYYGTPYAVFGFRLTWRAPDDSEFLCLDSTGGVATTNSGRPLYVDNDTRHQLSALHVEALRDLNDELRASQWTFLGRILVAVRDAFLQDPDFMREHAARARQLTDHVKGPPVVELETRMNEELRGITGFSSLSLTFDPPELIDSLKALRIRISEEAGLGANPAEELGQGLQSAVVIALVRAYQRMQKAEPILLIEEPEAYLHPQARRSFREILSRISKGGNCQVICTTHSTEFIDLVYPEEVYSVRKRPTDGTKVSRGDNLVATRPNLAQLKLATEFNQSVKEIVFSRCAILTEGPSEEWAITEGLRRSGMNPDSEGISVRNVGSKENLPFFLEVTRSLGVPVIAVFDSDVGTPASSAYHQALNQRIVQAAGGPANCWVSSPDFETAHAIPSTDRSKPRSALTWAQGMTPAEASRVFGPLLTALQSLGIGPPPSGGNPPAALPGA